MADRADLHASHRLGAGGPGFAPDFAGSPGRTAFGPAPAAGNLTGPASRSFEKVTLGTPASGHRRALFEREDSGSRGPHMLNRAFSGTYPEER